jgi:hypothetical protein
VKSTLYADTEFFDQEKSGLKKLSDVERATFFARKSEAEALREFVGNDRLLIESLLDLGMPFDDYYSLWLAENYYGGNARTLNGDTSGHSNIY